MKETAITNKIQAYMSSESMACEDSAIWCPKPLKEAIVSPPKTDKNASVSPILRPDKIIGIALGKSTKRRSCHLEAPMQSAALR